MTNPQTNTRLDKLKALRVTYKAQLPKRMTEIQLSWEALMRGDKTPDLRHNFHRLVHSLAGSAGTFGFMSVGEKARLLEHSIHSIVESDLHLPRVIMVQIAQHLADLTLAVDSDMAILPELLSPVDEKNVVSEVFEQVLPDSISALPTKRTLFVIENDEAVAEEIALQLSIYGWEVKIFSHTNDVKRALQSEVPTALLVDIMLAEDDISGTEFILQFKDKLNYPETPTVIISSRWDWESRLAAARAGVDAYYVKPIDFVALAERLDALTLKHTQEQFRVLVVEDEKLLAAHYAEVLTQANMDVRTTVTLKDVLENLNHFEPELLLLDLYMPHCNGIDMAKVIRQDDRFNDLPIVFLSTESGRQLQLAAMQSGADDFLQKPINNNDLISAVISRATRFRTLRQLIRQDSMTGLLNHIALKLQLEIEISRHQRTHEPMSVVMLDIDKFKHVNDTYGHPMGDRVIKSLSQLLQKRLRKTDVIGRYGGEEFAVVMSNTSLKEAEKVMNSIREHFEKIRHNSNDSHEFGCTFSAGISAFPFFNSVATVLQASDQALYQAKTQGRNRVCIIDAA